MLTIQRYNKPIYFTSLDDLVDATEESRKQYEAEEAARKAEEEARKAEEARRAAEEARKAAEEAARRERVSNILKETMNEYRTYPKINDETSKKAAAFMAKFVISVQRSESTDTPHKIEEFFGDEKTAEKLREQLSPECQRNSLSMRENIQKLELAKDPVMALITANNIKKFAPKKGILSEAQENKYVEGIKQAAVLAVKNGDMSQFEEEDIKEINEMVQMIEDSNSVDFGISSRLQALIDKLNSRNNKRPPETSFIPPVPVLERYEEPMQEQEVMQQHASQQHNRY